MMNPATQLFMLTPMCEWHYEEVAERIEDKGQTLLMHILGCMVDGEIESMSWEQILRCEPNIPTPDEFKSLCYDVFEYDLDRIEDVLGNCDIDWEKACEEFVKYMVMECMAREDEALRRLSEKAKETESDWTRFKKSADILIKDTSTMAKARVRKMVEYHEGKIKEHNKHLNYIKEQIEKQ